MIDLATVFVLAKNTFRESIRSKILYLLVFFVVLLLCLSLFFGKVTIGDEAVVVKNFGLFGISIFTMAYAAIAGTSFLQKELSKKTIYNILAKPVRRSDFLLGKYLGMLTTAACLASCMLPFLLLFTFTIERTFDFLLFEALLGILTQLIIICAVAIFFSAVVITPFLSGAFTVAVFLAGRSTNYLLSLSQDESLSDHARSLAYTVYTLLPHLDWLDLSDAAVYGIHQSANNLFWGLCYAFLYSSVLLLFATVFFTRREFN